jgi:DNA invertase Pin-like site-specific DNA recombinase
MSDVGYARVSTAHQSLDQQHDALTAAGCTRIFTDKLSGVREDRPGLAALLDYARAGDTVVVVALDRLGRSLSGVIRTVETLTEAGVLLRSLRRASTTPRRPGGCSPGSSRPLPVTNVS